MGLHRSHTIADPAAEFDVTLRAIRCYEETGPLPRMAPAGRMQ
jgi:DNA-binding transcriptional MerR regulator